jgi:rare lipoprotein A
LAKKTQSEEEITNLAQGVADQINQLAENNFDATTIAVHWNKEKQSYTIKVENEDLITLSDQIILADTTENIAQDALQVANRLRRLLGGASPISEIIGEPGKKSSRRVQQAGVRGQIQGIASWYGPGFHGRRSASGERFNQNELTAAHKTLPFGTQVRVTNLNNGRSVTVRINDRGPYSGRRVLDLSAEAARQIGMMGTGTAPVKIDVLSN